MPNKEPEFTVTDRRKFTSEGDIRPEVKEEEREQPEAPKIIQPEQPKPAPANPPAAEQPSTAPPANGEEPVAPPSAEDQRAQHEAYQQSNTTLDSQLRDQLGGQQAHDFEMTFERLVASMYMSALMQLGLDQRGEQRRVDIIGARQTIDTIALLQDKTKGNLTPNEDNLICNVLYELRMAYVETMNAIARSAQAGPEPGKA